VSGGRDATATLFLLLDLATFFDLYHGGKLEEALDTLEKIKVIPLNQQDVDYLVAGKSILRRCLILRIRIRIWSAPGSFVIPGFYEGGS
jgi:hypothetical protein